MDSWVNVSVTIGIEEIMKEPCPPPPLKKEGAVPTCKELLEKEEMEERLRGDEVRYVEFLIHSAWID